MMDIDPQQVTILLIDDDDEDRRLIIRSLKKKKIANKVVEAKDGKEGLELLKNNSVQKPYVVFLDLNMPRMSGSQVLDAIRGDSSLEDSVVFILTTSDEDKDRKDAYKHHVAGYIVKGNAGDHFSNLIELMECYWRVVELPS